MKSMEITAVGIDVSKRKSTVAIRRPGGVIVACPFDISHSSHDLEKLVSILKTTGGDIQQTQLRVRLRKSNPKGEDACVDFGAARKEARKNPKLGILRHGIHL